METHDRLLQFEKENTKHQEEEATAAAVEKKKKQNTQRRNIIHKNELYIWVYDIFAPSSNATIQKAGLTRWASHTNGLLTTAFKFV